MIEVGTFLEVAFCRGGYVLQKWTPNGEKDEDGLPVGPTTTHVTSDTSVLMELIKQAVTDIHDYGFEFKTGGDDGKKLPVKLK